MIIYSSYTPDFSVVGTGLHETSLNCITNIRGVGVWVQSIKKSAGNNNNLSLGLSDLNRSIFESVKHNVTHKTRHWMKLVQIFFSTYNLILLADERIKQTG
jgi:hypothetical protein